MARDTAKKKPKNKNKKARKGRSEDVGQEAMAGQPGAAAGATRPKVAKALKKAKSAASKLKGNPVVAEIVAAALVATAAALKDPKKAHRLAADAGDELKGAGKKASKKSEAFWNLALDIARRSVDALEPKGGAGASARASKRKK